MTTISYGMSAELACVFLMLGGLIVGQMIAFKREFRAKKSAKN